MKHFEDIWNEAETVDAQRKPLELLERLVSIQSLLDSYKAGLTLPSNGGLALEQGELVGLILFELCGITRTQNINSAAAMKLATDTHKGLLLDPDEE